MWKINYDVNHPNQKPTLSKDISPYVDDMDANALAKQNRRTLHEYAKLVHPRWQLVAEGIMLTLCASLMTAIVMAMVKLIAN